MAADTPTLTDAKRRVLERLKRAGPATARALAKKLSLTDVAVRQHLAALEEHGLVDQQTSKPTGPASEPAKPPAAEPSTPAAPSPPPPSSQPDLPIRPGRGRGDDNHSHSGPPGRSQPPP